MNSRHEAQSHHEISVLFKKRFTTDVNFLEKAVISNSSMLKSLSCTTTIRQNLTSI